MMNELVNEVAEKTGLSPEQAQSAVTAALEFLKARMPGPIATAIDGILGDGQIAAGNGQGGGVVEALEEGLEGKAMAAFGGIFGAKS